jgi:hypothetical protein
MLEFYLDFIYYTPSKGAFLISAFQNRETPRKEKEKRKEKKEAGGDFLEWRDKRAWKKHFVTI